MSIGISNASPPSLTHGCAGNIRSRACNTALGYAFVLDKGEKYSVIIQLCLNLNY